MTTLIVLYVLALALSTLVAVALRVKLTPKNTKSTKVKHLTYDIVLSRLDEFETRLNFAISKVEANNRNELNNTNTSDEKKDRAREISKELESAG